MLPNATRLANSAIAATVAVFDRRMIRISALLCPERGWECNRLEFLALGATRRSSKRPVPATPEAHIATWLACRAEGQW
jgi:hypothetical protein